MDLPAIERVPPELAGLAEIVRRHAGHEPRLALLVQVIQFGMSPDIGTVLRHEDRHVADEPDLLRQAGRPELLPLGLERKLHELVEGQSVGQLLAPSAQTAGSRVTSPGSHSYHGKPWWASRRA